MAKTTIPVPRFPDLRALSRDVSQKMASETRRLRKLVERTVPRDRDAGPALVGWRDSVSVPEAMHRREGESFQDWQRRLYPEWRIPAEDLPLATESWAEYKARVPHMFTHGDVRERRNDPNVADIGDAAMDAFRKRVRGLPFHEAVHVQPPTPKQLGLEEPEPFEHVSAGFVDDGDGKHDERPDHGTLRYGVNDGDGDDYPGSFGRPIENKPPPGGKFLGVVVPCPEHGGVGCDCDAHDDEGVSPSWLGDADYYEFKSHGAGSRLALGFALGVLSTIVAFVLIAGWLG